MAWTPHATVSGASYQVVTLTASAAVAANRLVVMGAAGKYAENAATTGYGPLAVSISAASGDGVTFQAVMCNADTIFLADYAGAITIGSGNSHNISANSTTVSTTIATAITNKVATIVGPNPSGTPVATATQYPVIVKPVF